MKSKKIVNIIIIVVTIVIIAGIWVYKNSTEDKGGGHSIDDGHGHSLEELGLSDDTTKDDENWKALDVDSIDLELLKQDGLPIMIDFGSETCPPCKEMRPTLEEVHKQFQGKVRIVYADVDKITKVSPQFPIEVVPTQYFFDKDGNPFVPADAQAMAMIMYQRKEDEKHVYTAHQGSMSKQELLDVFSEMGVNVEDIEDKEETND